MRTVQFLALAAFVCVLSIGFVSSTARAEGQKAEATVVGDLSGTWTYSFEGRDGETRTSTMTLKQDGEKLTGTVSGWQNQQMEITDGMVKDGVATWKVTREWNGNVFTSSYKAKLEGDTLMLTVEMPSRDGGTRTREFQAKRADAAATTQPAAT